MKEKGKCKEGSLVDGSLLLGWWPESALIFLKASSHLSLLLMSSEPVLTDNVGLLEAGSAYTCTPPFNHQQSSVSQTIGHD